MQDIRKTGVQDICKITKEKCGSGTGYQGERFLGSPNSFMIVDKGGRLFKIVGGTVEEIESLP